MTEPTDADTGDAEAQDAEAQEEPTPPPEAAADFEGPRRREIELRLLAEA